MYVNNFCKTNSYTKFKKIQIFFREWNINNILNKYEFYIQVF